MFTTIYPGNQRTNSLTPYVFRKEIAQCKFLKGKEIDCRISVPKIMLYSIG